MKEWNPKAVMALKVAILFIIAMVSIFVVSKWAVSIETHKDTIQALDDKRTTVMELTAASTAASAGITMIPGDIGTPIAGKLADLTSYFLIVICAIYLEKYLVTIVGYATFTILIPGACLLMILDTFVQSERCRKLAAKLVLFGLTIFIAIPASVKVSNFIEVTYSTSIEKTIESAKNSAQALDESADSPKEEEQGFLGGIISNVQESVTAATTEVENVLNHFIEALAVMIVTSCVIPILVLVFFVWLVKILLGVEIPLPKQRMRKGLMQRECFEKDEE